jgi:putative alpha-1,2-mannosidase
MKDITEYGRYFNGFDGQVHPSGDHDFYTADQPWDTYRCAHPLQAIIEPERINDILQSYVRMYEQYGFMPNTPNIGGDHASMVGRHITAIITDAYLKGFRNFDVEKAYEGMKKNALERTMLPWRIGPITELDRFYSEKGYFPALPVREDMKVEDPDGRKM